MSIIRILSDRVANQIAAGEVIERPAAVIKELVENALDAGATKVEIEFRHGGCSYLRVEDNGCGMTKDEALLALERHATSKIVETADLDRLAFFGFRGEALPSIASISRFELKTRPASRTAGTEILISGSKLLHVCECGLAPGTRIVVRHLFHVVPARQKFLKTDSTEAAYIVQTVRLYALACPHAAFTLIEDGRMLFKSPACSTLVERVGEIFGRQFVEKMLDLHAEENGLRLSGLVGKPGVNRAARHEMITFVNQRPVDSRTLSYALIESYATSIPKGRYPIAVLFFQLDSAAVDVNVHPAKREVRFRNERQVREFVIKKVLQKLRATGPTMSVTSPLLNPLPGASAPLPFSLQAAPDVPLLSLPNWALPRISVPWPQAVASSFSALPTEEFSLIAGGSDVLGDFPLSDNGWRFLGTVHGGYAIFESPGGVVVLDRRAVHERIWFEQLQKQFTKREVASQRLLSPVLVELDSITSAVLLERLKFLAAHGIEVGEFGRNSFRIEAVPLWLDQDAVEVFLRDVLALARDGRLDEKNLHLADDELARLAAQKGVRLPATLNEAEALSLVARLFACQQPHVSPGGRPTYFELEQSDLSRRFQRA